MYVCMQEPDERQFVIFYEGGVVRSWLLTCVGRSMRGTTSLIYSRMLRENNYTPFGKFIICNQMPLETLSLSLRPFPPPPPTISSFARWTIISCRTYPITQMDGSPTTFSCAHYLTFLIYFAIVEIPALGVGAHYFCFQLNEKSNYLHFFSFVQKNVLRTYA